MNGCRENKRKDAYRHYVEKVQTYGQQSQRLGRNLNALLTQRGTKESDVESELSGLARQQEQIASAARGLNPPGRLRAEDAHMLDALDLRSNGLRGMTDAFRSTASSKNAGTAGGELAVQMQRLIASDVIWQDLFKEPTKSELQRLRRHGRQRPGLDLPREPRHRHHCVDEVAVAAHPRHRGRRRHELLAARHRARLDESAPEWQGAVQGSLNTIPLSTDLVFTVTVKNSGCAQEVGLRVTLTIQQSPKPIKSRKTIPLIDSGNEESVSFSGLGLPPLDQKTSLTVEVDPVPGETNTTNNSANYPVQFSVQ